MKVIRSICVSGKVIEVEIKVSSGNHKSKRGARKNVTREMVQKNNDRIAAKQLMRILNANADSSWTHYSLTYKETVPVGEALRIVKNFLARLKRAMKKINMELKYVYATENTNRLHHHFISNAPIDLVRKCWQKGIVLPRPLDESANYYKLAEYIIKETSKTFRESESEFKSRYSRSRNLIVPQPRIEEVSPRQLSQDPIAFKGYYIDQDTVRRFEHPVTGLEHLEYMMVADSVTPRIKKWYKGKKAKKENYSKYINYAEKQESFFEYEEVPF